MEHSHQQCVHQSNKTLGFFETKSISCPQDVREAAFKGLVRPILEWQWLEIRARIPSQYRLKIRARIPSQYRLKIRLCTISLSYRYWLVVRL